MYVIYGNLFMEKFLLDAIIITLHTKSNKKENTKTKNKRYKDRKE